MSGVISVADFGVRQLARRLVAVALLFSAMMTGQSAFADDATSANPSASSERTARGLLRASMRVELQTQLQAPVAKLPFREGQRFSKDELLIGFDCSRYEAEAKAAKAGANAAWIDYKSKKRLLAHAAIGKDEVRLAGAKANQASAEAEITNVITSQCSITAPFDGLVVEVNARPHEQPQSQAPLMVILDDSKIEVEMVVPSTWLTWLKTGARFRFRIEETGQTVSGRVDRLSAEIDAVSQTIRIFGILENSTDVPVLAGMSGTADFAEAVDG